ncbi:MAG TPA: DUF2167 domain-containing protein [Armatimonadota bacterium]|jgi:uncharacterized membrane-anchored protein
MTSYAAAVLTTALLGAQALAPQGPAPQQPILQQPEDKISWTEGPTKVDLGLNVAELALDEAFVFANAADTRKMLYAMGNRPNGNELGMVAPKDENQEWMVIFKYLDVGYVSDEEKDKIDADELLKSIKEGTEEANQERASRGIPALHVVGWQQKPQYDSATHNFTWAILAKNEGGEEVVNYNVRILGREGYMSVTLADDPKNLETSKPIVEKILGKFSFKSGKTYSEYRQGDKVAQYGLTALVAAGAGAAGVKLGLFAVFGKFLAKAWKVVVVVLVGLGGFVKKLFGGGRSGPMSGSGE